MQDRCGIRGEVAIERPLFTGVDLVVSHDAGPALDFIGEEFSKLVGRGCNNSQRLLIELLLKRRYFQRLGHFRMHARQYRRRRVGRRQQTPPCFGVNTRQRLFGDSGDVWVLRVTLGGT